MQQVIAKCSALGEGYAILVRKHFFSRSVTSDHCPCQDIFEGEQRVFQWDQEFILHTYVSGAEDCSYWLFYNVLDRRTFIRTLSFWYISSFFQFLFFFQIYRGGVAFLSCRRAWVNLHPFQEMNPLVYGNGVQIGICPIIKLYRVCPNWVTCDAVKFGWISIWFRRHLLHHVQCRRIVFPECGRSALKLLYLLTK
jgi:hypothetical protein